MEQLRVLCVGDSLTEGFTHSGWDIIFHPYGEAMASTLRQGMPNIQFHVDIEGASGDRVCPPGLFMPRIQAKFKTNTYDWVLLLGGTNDLAWGVIEAPKIFSGLQDVENVALAHGSKILVMTVPETAPVNRDLEQRRNALNSSIRSQCDNSQIFLFDLFQKIPYHSLPPTERKRIWDDGVHFTAQGYDLMGSHLAVRLMQIISASSEGKEEGNSNPEEAVTQTEKKLVRGLEFEKFGSESESDDGLNGKVFYGQTKKRSSHRCRGGACVIL